jgi:hypothetical protein
MICPEIAQIDASFITTEDAEVAEIRRRFPQTFGARLRSRVIRGIRVAHASRVLVSASRRNNLSRRVRCSGEASVWKSP